MKKNVLYLLALICSLSFFTACNDDDKLEPIGDSVTGVYLGELKIALGDEKPGDDAEKIAQKVYITKTGDNTIEMQLKNFSFGAIELGTIKVDQCEAIKEGESYKFKGAQSMKLESVGDCDVALTGIIVGNKIDMDISVLAKADGATLNVQVIFSGTKLAADLSSEADMLTFTFDNPVVLQQPIIDGLNITFSVSENITDEELMSLVPTFTISANATVDKESGVETNFTGDVSYTVTSQDGIVAKTYIVRCIKKGLFDLYSFEDWTVSSKYSTPTGWATCNPAAALISWFDGEYPVTKFEVGSVGSAVKIMSVDTKGGTVLGQKVPKVTSGTTFLGTFNALAALGGALKTTKFGIMWDRKPLSVEGVYKYTPGKDYYVDMDIDNTKKDACAISAVLYEVAKSSESLDGTNIYDETKITAIAQFTNGNEVSEFTPFKLELKYLKEYDPEKLYKFAVIFSSSVDGAAYNGAIGSTLIVDEVSIVSE